MPALGYYLGAAFALVLLALRPVLLLAAARDGDPRRRSRPPPSLYAAARVGGTPYTAAKAIEVAAPLVALAILLPLLARRALCRWACESATGRWRPVAAAAFVARRRRLLAARPRQRAGRPDRLLAGADRAAPAGRRRLDPVLASDRAARRGTRRPATSPGSCAAAASASSRERATARRAAAAGVRFVVTDDGDRRPPFAGLRLRRDADPYLLWERTGPVRGQSPCPLIAVRQARQGPAALSRR